MSEPNAEHLYPGAADEVQSSDGEVEESRPYVPEATPLYPGAADEVDTSDGEIAATIKPTIDQAVTSDTNLKGFLQDHGIPQVPSANSGEQEDGPGFYPAPEKASDVEA